MTLREELEDRADKLDAEMLALSGRMKEIERQSNELHTCLNALDIAEMDAEDAAQHDLIDEASVALEQLETDHALPPSADDVVTEPHALPMTVDDLPITEAIAEVEAATERLLQTEGYAPVTNPDADFWARGLERDQKPQTYNPFNIFRREKEEA